MRKASVVILNEREGSVHSWQENGKLSS